MGVERFGSNTDRDPSQLVVLGHLLKYKESGSTLRMPLLDLAAFRAGLPRHEQIVYTTKEQEHRRVAQQRRNLEPEAFERLLQTIQEKSIPHRIRYPGAHPRIEALPRTRAELEALPDMEFVAVKRRVLLSRTQALFPHEIPPILEECAALDIPLVDELPRDRISCRLFDWRGFRRLEIGFLITPELRDLESKLHNYPHLNDRLLRYVYEHNAILPEKEGKRFEDELIAHFNSERGFSIDFQSPASATGKGFDRRDGVRIKALTTRRDVPELIEQGFSHKGIGSNKMRSDMSQQDEQRIFSEIAYPACHFLDGTPLSREDVATLIRAVNYHTLGFDIETSITEEQLALPKKLRKPGYHAPPAHIITINSENEKVLHVSKEFSVPDIAVLHDTPVHTAKDSFQLVRAFDQEAENFYWLTCVNGIQFDLPLLHAYNTRLTDKKVDDLVAHWMRSHKIVRPDLPEDVYVRWESEERGFWKELQRVQEDNLEEFRALAREKRHVVNHRRVIDPWRGVRKGGFMYGGGSLQHLSPTIKSIQAYGTLANFIRSHDPKERLLALEYTVDDGSGTREAFDEVLEDIVADAIVAARPIESAADAKPATNVTRDLAKRSAKAGKPFRHQGTRTAVQKYDDETNEALDFLNLAQFASSDDLYEPDSGLYRNPLLVFSQRHVLQQQRLLVTAFNYVQNAAHRVRRFKTAERYAIAVVRTLTQALGLGIISRGEPDNPQEPLSQEEFWERMNSTYKSRDPEGRLRHELFLGRNFSLYQQYRYLWGTARRMEQEPVIGQAHEFLVGGLTWQGAEHYKIAQGPVAIANGHVLAVGSRVNGDPVLLCPHLRIPKSDLPARADLLATLQTGEPRFSHKPGSDTIKKIYESLERVLPQYEVGFSPTELGKPHFVNAPKKPRPKPKLPLPSFQEELGL